VFAITSLIVLTRPGIHSCAHSIATLLRAPAPITIAVDAVLGARSGRASTAAAPNGTNSATFARNSSTG